MDKKEAKSTFMSFDLDQSVALIKQEEDIIQKVKKLSELVKLDEVKLKDVAAKLGVQSSYVCHLLRLTRIPDAVIDGYYSNNISLSHLFIISRLKDPAVIINVYEKVLSDTLSVKKTEELVRNILYGVKTQGEYLSQEEKEIFKEKIKTLKKNINLDIIQTRIKSKIVLEFKGDLENTSKLLRGFMKFFELWK